MINFLLILASVFDYNLDFYFTLKANIYNPSYTVYEDDYVEVALEIDFYAELETELAPENSLVFDNEYISTSSFDVLIGTSEEITTDNLHHITIDYSFTAMSLNLTPTNFEFYYDYDINVTLWDWRDTYISSGNVSGTEVIYKEVNLIDSAQIDFNFNDFSQYYYNLNAVEDSYNRGYYDGKEAGYQEATSIAGSVGAFIKPVFEAIADFLSFELMPGWPLGVFVAIPLIFGIISFIINLWR